MLAHPLSGRTTDFSSFFTCQKCPAGLSCLTTSLTSPPQTCIPLLFWPFCNINHTAEPQFRQSHLSQPLYFHTPSEPGPLSLVLPLHQCLCNVLSWTSFSLSFLTVTPLTLYRDPLPPLLPHACSSFPKTSPMSWGADWLTCPSPLTNSNSFPKQLPNTDQQCCWAAQQLQSCHQSLSTITFPLPGQHLSFAGLLSTPPSPPCTTALLLLEGHWIGLLDNFVLCILMRA